MAKNLKLNIKNQQLAEALQLGKLKKKKAEEKKAPVKKPAPKKVPSAEPTKEPAKEPAKPVEKKPPVKKATPPPEEAAPPAPKKEKTEAAPAAAKKDKAEATPAPAPAKPAGPIDDFRKPKIIRKKALPPVKKAPITRKDAKPGDKATKPAGAQTDKPKDAPPRKPGMFKDYRDLRSERKTQAQKSFDARDRMGLRDSSDDRWRKKRGFKRGGKVQREDMTIRPKSLHVRLPITVKDLATEMKLKASQLIQKLFADGVVLTINDYLEDETTIQLLGHEFNCEITIDTSEEERIKITDQTIREEVAAADPAQLSPRPPVVTFMGHVDHGKTSLIDVIRKTNLAEGEAGAITQHIGAFKCHSDMGEITILDTPGHEAFSAMRERGAEVTDLVGLVVAGDEGIRDQTVEAINQAKAAGVPILVAINKSDKPGFDAENIYRQLSEHELLPEAWGGTTITVNCSATTGEGIKSLLEMLALQSEVLELSAQFSSRARGSVIESAMHKGLGVVVTLLVQNGTLKRGDNVVFDLNYARVKTMHDEHGKELEEAPPSTPIKITGLSGLPEAGSEFIVVENEKEAREIAKTRQEEHKQRRIQKGKRGLEGLLEKNAEAQEKKVLHVLLRADVQGSLEALKQSLQKIKSDKAELNIVSEDVGQISESDVSLAGASGATILGFHTKVESHAEGLIKEKKVIVKLHDIIYHAVDDIKEEMRKLLDKLPQENEMGTAEVKAIFKSSHLGIIAGCQIADGLIKRGSLVRLKRGDEVIWKGSVDSLKRGKDDAKEVSKGLECGIVLKDFTAVEVGDIIEAYDITYLEQEL